MLEGRIDEEMDGGFASENYEVAQKIEKLRGNTMETS